LSVIKYLLAMKITRQVSVRQVKRIKMMTLVFLGGLVYSMLMPQMFQMVDAENPLTEFDGPYTFEGVDYAGKKTTNQASGYVEEYTDREAFC
jgi:hypothetical protein